MAENLIGHVSKNVQEKITPNAQPTKVPRGLHVTARGLRSTSEVAVKASGFVGTYTFSIFVQLFFSIPY